MLSSLEMMQKHKRMSTIGSCSSINDEEDVVYGSICEVQKPMFASIKDIDKILNDCISMNKPIGPSMKMKVISILPMNRAESEMCKAKQTLFKKSITDCFAEFSTADAQCDQI